MTKITIWAAAAMVAFTSLSARAIEGLSERIDITFSYEEGFDAIGTIAFESASTAHNIQLSTLSDCHFMFVPNSPDGRITEEYPDANFAFCAAPGEDVIGRIDFIQPIQFLTIRIPYFANGIVTFQAFSKEGVKLHEMQAQYRVGFEKGDIDGGEVAYVILSGNHQDAAINIDDIVMKTVGFESAVLQVGNSPLLIEVTEFEAMENALNPDTIYWREFADRGAHGRTLFAVQGATSPDDPDNQDSVLRFPVVMQTPGQYYLYLHGRRLAETLDTSKPRVWVSAALNEAAPSGDFALTLNNTYRWHRFGPITVSGADLGKARSLYLGVRTAGVSIDELVLAPSGALSKDQLEGLLEQAGRPVWDADYSALEFDWTQLRGNRRQTGHSQVVGVLDSTPALKTSLDYGHQHALIGIDLDTLSDTTLSPFTSSVESVPDDELARNWRYDQPIFQMNAGGDEQYLKPRNTVKFGHWLPGESNLQRITTDRSEGKVLFSKWSTSGWQTLWAWENQGGELIDVTQPLVADFDNDGRLEIAFTPWYNLWVVDLETGILEQKTQFIPDESDNGRPYGWSGGIDMFEDDRMEFLLVADFHNHMEVLGWNQQNELEKRWDWMIENGTSAKVTIIHPGVNPVGNVIAGNNMLEIVVSVFNSTGDGKWHTLVMSSLDGTVLQDFPERYISRLHDVNADGFHELMLTPTEGRLVRENLGGSIISLESGVPQTLFSFNKGSFAEYDLQMLPDNMNTDTGKREETVFIAEFDTGKPVFATWNDARNVLTFWRFTNDVDATTLGTVDSGIYSYILEPTGFDFAGTSAEDILIRARSFDTSNTFNSDFQAALFSNRVDSSSSQPGPVIGKLVADEPPAVIVDAGLNLLRKATMRNGDLAENWSMNGRSTAQEGANIGQSLLLADVSGDQYYELLGAGRGQSGVATMTATRDGSALWTTEFAGFQGWLPNWNENGLLAWNAGKFRGDLKDNVSVSLRRSSMSSDETHLLDGETGQDIWTRKSLWQGKVESTGRGRGAGGSISTVLDFNLDNRDELVVAFHDGIAVLKGEDGSSMVEKFSTEIFGSQEFLSLTIPFSDETNIPRLSAFNTTYGVSLFENGLDLVWSVGNGGAHSATAVLADVNGDGVKELVVIGDDSRSSIVAYNADGSRHWTFNITTNRAMAVSADIDNDGRDEILYIKDNQLVVVEEHNGAPAEKWTWTSPDWRNLGPPALGDIDEDGDLEIVLFDGKTVYVLGNSAQSPEPAVPQIRLASEQFEKGGLRVSWEHAAFATAYRLLIASDVAMSNIIDERSMPRHQSSLVRHFDPGEYWIQLEASNLQGTSLSAVRHLVVSEPLNKLPGIFADGFE